jgi:hypothetical protein
VPDGGNGYYQFLNQKALWTIQLALMHTIIKNTRMYSFLCQTNENTVPHTPTRAVTIPKGTSIFMPIINWISILHIDGETDQELTEIANKEMDVVANLEITIDGLRIKNGLEEYRILSPCFEIWLPRDNIVASSPGMRRAISDGYWLFLKSLETDTIISSFGSCSSCVTKIGVNYNLFIG